MGNCLVIQGRKAIKMMRVADGSKVLGMPSPPSPAGILKSSSRPPGHGMVSGVPPVKSPAAAAAADPGGAAVRVKLVISKQELRRMLVGKEGMSLDDMVSLLRGGEAAGDDRGGGEQGCCGGWRPALESIPEGTDDLSS
ncbi:hypothetical protein ACP4OV_014793 [Aristida adscensionis]